MAITYELEYNEIGQAVTRVAASSPYDISGLSGEANYQCRVRALDTTNGVTMFSPWSTYTTFTTLAAPQPKTVELGLVTETPTLYPIAPELEVVSVEVPATQFELELEDLLTNTSIFNTVDVSVSSIDYDTLYAFRDYRVRIRGKANTGSILSDWSEWTYFLTLSTELGLAVQVTSTDTPVQLDLLNARVGYTSSKDQESIFEYGITANQEIESATGTFDGIPLNMQRSTPTQFVGQFLYGSIVLSYEEELDGNFLIKVDDTNILGL